MDQVRRISAIIALVLVTLVFGGCSVGGDPEPPEYRYRIFSFKNDSYKEYVLAGHVSNEQYILFSYTQGIEDFKGYALLHNEFLIPKYAWVSKGCSLTNILWSEYDFNEHDFYFSKEEMLDYHPFSSFYEIPEHVLGKFSSYPIREETIAKLNAMIDDGSIEQYRVDLGY